MNYAKRLAEIQARKLEIRGILESDNAEIKLDELETELRNLETEVNEIEKRKSIAAGISSGTVEVREIAKPAAKVEARDFNSLTPAELYETEEYRSAFLKTLQRKELTETEKRAATTSSAVAAVPTTTLNMIIDKLRQTSALFPRISVSFVPGNLKFVVANAKNAAAWNTEGTDGTPADDTVTSITLGGFELIKLAEISAAAEAMTISAFEAYIASEIGRQMSIAIENAIINGVGTTEPTGILAGVTFNAANLVEFDIDVDYDSLVDGIALLPTMYHQNAIFVMSRKMMFGSVRKVKDAEGEPIFVIDPTQKGAMTILGYSVVIDDYIDDDTILFGDMSYYFMNFSKQVEITSDRSVGFKSGKVVYRGLAVADGKPALNEAFVKIAKALM